MRNITKPLLEWYRKNRRELPWRQNPTAYRVWVSEIMLQQTRIEAAKGYFERFMTALPDVYALADAHEETVLKLWEGLGYYSRARNLHKTAKLIVDEYGGEFPQTAAELTFTMRTSHRSPSRAPGTNTARPSRRQTPWPSEEQPWITASYI